MDIKTQLKTKDDLLKNAGAPYGFVVAEGNGYLDSALLFSIFDATVKWGRIVGSENDLQMSINCNGVTFEVDGCWKMKIHPTCSSDGPYRDFRLCNSVEVSWHKSIGMAEARMALAFIDISHEYRCQKLDDRRITLAFDHDGCLIRRREFFDPDTNMLVAPIDGDIRKQLSIFDPMESWEEKVLEIFEWRHLRVIGQVRKEVSLPAFGDFKKRPSMKGRRSDSWRKNAWAC